GRIGALRAEECDDLRATAILRVLQRLRAGAPERAPIENFEGYVAMVTLHACDDLLRERMPRRTLAKNRLRYVLGHDRRFAQWDAGGESVCGLEAWRGAQEFATAVVAEHVRHTAGDHDVAR